MYTFSFTYTGDHHQNYANIKKIEYNSNDGLISVSGNDILSHEYPLDFDLHLISELKSYKVPHNCLKSIKVTKEKN